MIAVLGMVTFACTETEIESDALRTNLEFQAFIPETVELLKSTPINRPEGTPVNVESFFIEAIHQQGTVSETFTIEEEASGFFGLKDVWVGNNNLRGHTTCANPLYGLGLSVNSSLSSEWVKDVPIYAEYTCDQNLNVLYKNNKKTTLKWSTEHGRLFIMVKFEDPSMLGKFSFKGINHLGNEINQHINGNTASFYWNNKYSIDGAVPVITVKADNFDKIISSVNASAEDLETLTVNRGVDKYITVIIKTCNFTEDVAFEVNFPNFTETPFNLNW